MAERAVVGSSNGRRFDQLDALRGIAALTVVFNHCVRVIPGSGSSESVGGNTALGIVKYTPLHLVWAGHQAVMFFFVLSGFVLTLPFLRGRADPYGTFVLRRICRIWIPYVVIVAAALGARVAFRPYSDGHSISSWVDQAWREDLSPLLLLNHASLIGPFKDTLIDPVVWSLTIEMRISIVFPLLVWVALRWRWQLTLIASFVVGAIGYAMDYKDVAANLGRTIAFVPLFVVGILLAKHRADISTFLAARKQRFGMWPVLGLAVLVYTSPWWVLPTAERLHVAPVDDWAATAGVVLFIAAALTSKRVIRALTHRIPMWLGRISYSLYLIHAVVLLSFVHLFYGNVPLVVIWMLTVVVSLALATVAYRYVEVPALELGRRLARRRRHRPEPADEHARSDELNPAPTAS